MRMRKILGVILAVAFIGWAIVYVCRDEAALSAFRHAYWPWIAACAVAQVLFLYVNGVFLQIAMASKGKKLGASESFALSSATTFANSFLPLTGGLVLRAVYLKKKHAFDYADFVAISAGGYLINYLIVFILGAFAALYLWAQFQLANTLLNLILLAGIAGILVLLIVPIDSMKTFFNRFPMLRKVLESWRVIKSDSSLLTKWAFLSLANFLIAAGTLYTSLCALHEVRQISEIFLLTVMESLTLFIKITPGNLGVTELLLAIPGKTLGIPFSILLLASAINRGTMYLTLILLFPFSVRQVFRSPHDKTSVVVNDPQVSTKI